jgi:hypothetical protein
LNVRLLQELAKFVVGIARGIVLAVGDDQKRALTMMALLDLLRSQVDCVIERL